MSDFEREERYIVIKRKYLDEASESALRGVIHGLDLPTEECVVVEHDWPNYYATWRSVQQVAEGTYDPDELTRLQSEVERLRGRCGDQFLCGACATLAMFDPKSTEYHEAVAQHGGYEALYAVAEEYDRQHLYVAAKWNEGAKYAGDLHVKIYEAEREAQRLRQQAAESAGGEG